MGSLSTSGTHCTGWFSTANGVDPPSSLPMHSEREGEVKAGTMQWSTEASKQSAAGSRESPKSCDVAMQSLLKTKVLGAAMELPVLGM
jgi:hypothetical protein